MSFDLLTTVEQGGCSAKLPASILDQIVSPSMTHHPNLLVGIDHFDDAAVWKINDELALIHTTDFFPPVCSDPFDFGEIAAANAMSDVYAMGGEVTSVMNLVMFPSTKIPISVLSEIMNGAAHKVAEAEAVIVGGHSIEDATIKFGLAVTGTVHPDRFTSNALGRPHEALILTKSIGTGVVLAARKLGMDAGNSVDKAIRQMKRLNRHGAHVMRSMGTRCATDITGFSLLGHALRLAQGSQLSLVIDSSRVPFIDGAYDLAEAGCLPGAIFRNLKSVEAHIAVDESVDYTTKMLLLDAQTSGGLLFSCPMNRVDECIRALQEGGDMGVVIGNTLPFNGTSIEVI